jgi:HEAT repeat protein
MVREMRDATTTEMSVMMLDDLPPERRALLLRAIGDRKDAPPLDVIVKASKSDSPAVREAAIYVLTKHGDASAVAILLDAALAGGDVAAAAKDGLQTLPGKEVDEAIAAKLSSADAKAKPILLELVGARQILAATPTVREAMADADRAVRLAALAAMAQLIEVKDLDVLIWAAGGPRADAAEIAAAEAALTTAAQRMGDRDACAAKLAQYLEGASASTRSDLLELLGKVSGKTALSAVVAAAKSPDPATKDAATRVLGEWLNTDAAGALLEIAKSDPEKKYQIRALRGYIRIARQLETPWWEKSNAGETKLAMFRSAMEVAQRAEEKQLALDVLTRIPSPTTLSLAVSHLGDPATKEAAAAAAVKIAGNLVGDDPKAVADAMQKVVESGVGGQPADRAKQLLDRAKAAK